MTFKFKELTKTIYFNRPLFWGTLYIILIVLFALIYLIFPSGSFENGPLDTFTDSMYFSTVTVTSLGFGDIYPVTVLAKWFVVAEIIFGVVIIGLFLNSVAHSQAVADSETEKKAIIKRQQIDDCAQILRYDTLIQTDIAEYVLYQQRIVTPMNERGMFISDYPKRDFVFQDLCDLYQPTLIIKNDFNRCTAEYYFEALKRLRLRIEQFVLNANTSLASDLEQVCLQFIKDWNEYDSSESVLMGNRDWRNGQSKLVREWKGEVKYYPSNAINSYISIYYMIKATIRFIDNYNKAIEEVKTKRNKLMSN